MKAGISDYTSGLHAFIHTLYLRSRVWACRGGRVVPGSSSRWRQWNGPRRAPGPWFLPLPSSPLTSLCSCHFVLFLSLRKIVLLKKFINLRLHWVFIAARGLSLVGASGGYSPVTVHRLLISGACVVAEHGLLSVRGFSSCGMWTQHAAHGLWRASSVVVAHRLSCPMARGIFLDHESNACPLQWQVDS